MEHNTIDLAGHKAGLSDTIGIIANLKNRDVVQMNLDFIERVMQDKCPVAIGIVLGDFQLLFEEVLAKLETDED